MKIPSHATHSLPGKNFFLENSLYREGVAFVESKNSIVWDTNSRHSVGDFLYEIWEFICTKLKFNHIRLRLKLKD